MNVGGNERDVMRLVTSGTGKQRSGIVTNQKHPRGKHRKRRVTKLIVQYD